MTLKEAFACIEAVSNKINSKSLTGCKDAQKRTRLIEKEKNRLRTANISEAIIEGVSKIWQGF